MQEIKELSVIDGKSLLALDVEPTKFIISRLMPTGLHMLAGSPKIGKSWLALWLCNQISNGAKVWEFDTLKCGTLYLALEDTVDRLSIRLSRITETGSDNSYFSTEADNLSGALVGQLERFIADYPDTGLIVIDTFQRVRDVSNDKNTYSNDYEEIKKIKAVADKHKIAILLVHHLRKMPDNDPFNMVSGSTGIIGAVDSVYVLEKENRTSNKAKLHVTGRDIEDMQISLEFDREETVWRFVSFLNGNEKKEDKLVATINALISDCGRFAGTATELAGRLKELNASYDFKPNTLTRTLKEQATELNNRYGVTVTFNRMETRP